MVKTIRTEKNIANKIGGIIVWFVGILVSLSVGSGMATRVLTIPYIPTILAIITGWFIIIGIILGLVIIIFNK